MQELLLHKGTECKSYRGTDGSYYKAVELEWHCAHKSEILENDVISVEALQNVLTLPLVLRVSS